jgi:hypothetical protein
VVQRFEQRVEQHRAGRERGSADGSTMAATGGREWRGRGAAPMGGVEARSLTE